MGGVEGKQRVKSEEVTALVPRVEKAAEMLTAAPFLGEYAESCNLIYPHFILRTQAESGL
jgi:hypothetical protein